MSRALSLRALSLVLVAALAACGGPAPQADNNVAGEIIPNEAEAGVALPGNAADATNASEARPDAAAAFDRLGAIRIGATLKALQRDGLAVARQDEPLDEESTCTYATFKGLPDVAVMLEGERIVRIDVNAPGHPTLGGVSVGQSEAEALRRLGGKAKVEPHPYQGPVGHYLVVHEKGAPRGLILETDGKTVSGYRFGQWEQVQWIEGCA